MFITVKKKFEDIFQRCNQKPCIEKQTLLTIQWPNKKGRNDNNGLQIITQKTKKLATWTPQKTEVEVWCFGRVCSSCSIIGTRRFIRERKYWSYLSLIASLLHFRRIKWLTFAVSEWLLFTAKSANCQLFHGENKLIFNEMMMRSALY
jgi:hypothetical protein